jgi:hypothetical protein
MVMTSTASVTSRTQTVTLVYSAHDEEHNDAVVLRDVLLKKRGVSAMTKRFEIGDHVTWNSEAGGLALPYRANWGAKMARAGARMSGDML